MDEVILLRGVRCVVTECATCGVIHTVPEVVYLNHRQEGGFHHCPNGHQWGWSQEGCERERLRRERDRLAQQIAQRDDEITRMRAKWGEAETRVQTAEKARHRIETRAHNGVCPHCNRTVRQLARHIASKHPTARAQ